MRMKVSPDTTSRIVIHFSRIGFTMAFIIWVCFSVAVLFVAYDGAIGGRVAILFIILGLVAAMVMYAGVTSFLVQQWRLMNTPAHTPPPQRNATRRIPLNTPSKTFLLEIDE